jgi:hypothetical protein
MKLFTLCFWLDSDFQQFVVKFVTTLYSIAIGENLLYFLNLRYFSK